MYIRLDRSRHQVGVFDTIVGSEYARSYRIIFGIDHRYRILEKLSILVVIEIVDISHVSSPSLSPFYIGVPLCSHRLFRNLNPSFIADQFAPVLLHKSVFVPSGVLVPELSQLLRRARIILGVPLPVENNTARKFHNVFVRIFLLDSCLLYRHVVNR